MEIRSSEITTSASNTLTGYVVRWDNLSELLWGEFYEKFQRGAFTEWLAAGNDMSMTTACYWGAPVPAR